MNSICHDDTNPGGLDPQSDGGVTGTRSISEILLTQSTAQLSLSSQNSVGTDSTIYSDSIQSLYEYSNNGIRGSTPSFDILPSYQMHQSILNRPLSLEGEESIDALLPTYSLSDSSEEPLTLPTTTIDLPEDSILQNINSIPVMPLKNDLRITIELQKSDRSYYTSGDCVSGIITVENTSKNPIPFEMFLVTFEGEMKVSAGFVVEEKIYKYKNFLRMVDLGASWTDAEVSRYHPKKKLYYGLPSNRVLAANTKYQKLFTFTIPSSSLEEVCRDSIIDHAALPSTFGSADLSIASIAIEDKLYEKFSYSDLTVPGYTVNYSVNARVISLSKGDSYKYIVKSVKKNSICFISSSGKREDPYHDYKKYRTSPSYQLNLLIKQIERHIDELKTTIDEIAQDNRILVYERRRRRNSDDEDENDTTAFTNNNIFDDSKRRNLYVNSGDCSLDPQNVVDEQYIKRYKKDYRFFRKKKKPKQHFFSLAPSKSPSSSSSPLNVHDSGDISINDFDCGTLSISSVLNDDIILDFDMLVSPFNKNGASNISIPLTIDFNYIMPTITSLFDQSEFAKYFPLEPDVDLMYINITTKGNPIPIDLDFEWFTSRKKFTETIKSKFFNLTKLLKNLPNDSLISACSLRNLRAMNQINYEIGTLSRAISVRSSKSTAAEYDEQQSSLNSKLHLDMVLNSSKFKSTLLVPDFQSCLVGRFYFMRLKFKADSSLCSNSDINYDSQTEDVIKNLDGNYKFYLDVPISIKKVD